MIFKTLAVGQLQTNCYIIGDDKTGEAIIIDPGDDAEYIENTLRDLNLKPTQILATHGHFDHILAVFELQQAYTIPFFIGERDLFLVKRMRESATYFLKIRVPDLSPHVDYYLQEDMKIRIGTNQLSIIETPGHTPGSNCIYSKENDLILTGDTIFAHGGVGRTDFNYASHLDLSRSIIKILRQPVKTKLYPGHGQDTSIIAERKYHNIL